jgi:hypothetical protein
MGFRLRPEAFGGRAAQAGSNRFVAARFRPQAGGLAHAETYQSGRVRTPTGAHPTLDFIYFSENIRITRT